MNRSLDELCRIAANGGGMKLDGGSFSTEDLCRVAASASSKRATIVISKADRFSTDDLCRIAASGKGCVSLE